MEKKYPFERGELKKAIANVTAQEPSGKTLFTEHPYPDKPKMLFEANLAGIRELGELHSKNPLKLERWKSKDGKYPVIVLIHGMASNSKQKLIKNLASMYENLGVPVVRLNMDETKHEEMFHLDHKSDFLVKVLERLSKIKWVDASRIGIVAHSQGGVVLSNAVPEIEELGLKPKSVATISSPHHYEDNYQATINAGNFLKPRHNMLELLKSMKTKYEINPLYGWNVHLFDHAADLITISNLVNSGKIPSSHTHHIIANKKEYERQLMKSRSKVQALYTQAAKILGVEPHQGYMLHNLQLSSFNLTEEQKEKLISIQAKYKKIMAHPYKYALDLGDYKLPPHNVIDKLTSIDPHGQRLPQELEDMQRKIHNWERHTDRSTLFEKVALATLLKFIPHRNKGKI